jgi:hypothetical protein
MVRAESPGSSYPVRAVPTIIVGACCIKSPDTSTCLDAETGEQYWISGPKKNGEDKLYGGVVEIDEDAREDYWLKIRRMPQCVNQRSYRSNTSL